jgi:pimeloyl-ACP methyl ester carboxylesterase
VKAHVERSEQGLRILVVEPDAPPASEAGATSGPQERPCAAHASYPGRVLLFLHGKGEASHREDELPLVCKHLSPPFQAILGRIRNATVVAPQAPRDPDSGWTWRDHLDDLARFVGARFPSQVVVAVGFSRGGLGVLQLRRRHPQLASRWAVVDPQRAEDAAERADVLGSAPDPTGWLRYGNAIPENTPFSRELATRLAAENVDFHPELGHGDLALAAFTGDPLKGGPGARNLYDFLGVWFR